MDPLSQGVVGVVASQQLAKKSQIVLASICGIVAGMTPDLDVLISSPSDPLIALEYHRQFTHSLFFIPFGGLLCALILYWILTRRFGMSFKWTFIFCTLGYASHGLLDACTSYGTQLFWPVSDMRVSWDTISIIDPLFTLPLLLLVISAVWRRQRLFAIAAIIWLALYMTLGVIQRERAKAVGWQLVEFRGHEAVKLEVKPSFANILLWKIIYTTETEYVVDAVRLGLSNTRIFPGTQVEKLNITQAFPWLDSQSQQARDIERFRWFSQGYLAVSSKHPDVIIDMRYSMLPNQADGLWGIRLQQGAAKDQHVEYLTLDRDRPGMFNQLWEMLTE